MKRFMFGFVVIVAASAYAVEHRKDGSVVLTREEAVEVTTLIEKMVEAGNQQQNYIKQLEQKLKENKKGHCI